MSLHDDLPDRPSRGPRPPPQPVCNHNCGQVFADGARLSEITCPCGFGYYDRQKNEFIPGSLVRDGKAPSRAEYVAHVRRCPERQEGSPRVAQVFLGVHKEDGTYTSRSEARHQTSAVPRPSPAPLERARVEGNQDGAERDGQPQPSEQKASSNYDNTTPERPIFIPKADIEREPLEFYLSLCGFKNVDLKSHQPENKKPGWILKGLNLKLDTSTWKTLLQDVMEDSKAWQAEIRNKTNVPYPMSEAAAERRRNGTVKLRQARRRGSSPANVSRASQLSNQRQSTTPSQHHGPNRYGSETTDGPKNPSVRLDPSLKVDPRRGEKKDYPESRQVVPVGYQPERTSDSRHTRVDSGISLPVRRRRSTQQKKPFVPDGKDDFDDLRELSDELYEED